MATSQPIAVQKARFFSVVTAAELTEKWGQPHTVLCVDLTKYRAPELVTSINDLYKTKTPVAEPVIAAIGTPGTRTSAEAQKLRALGVVYYERPDEKTFEVYCGEMSEHLAPSIKRNVSTNRVPLRRPASPKAIGIYSDNNYALPAAELRELLNLSLPADETAQPSAVKGEADSSVE